MAYFQPTGLKEAVQKSQPDFWATHIGNEAVLEPFCEKVKGLFTIIVIQNKDGTPIALVPSGIEVCYENNGIFDYRRKYLPTNNTKWPCPPAFFEDAVIEHIQQQTERLFTLLR